VQAKQSKVWAGCCGFAMAQEKYFHALPCVEINSSFYQLPRLETAKRWRAIAPKDFQFAMKAWQVITHRATSPTYKRTRIDPRDREHCGHFGFNPTIRWAWDETFSVATALGAVLVLFQCPASFRPTRENIAGLERFFERAKRGKFFMGWEPRGDWDAQLVGKLCKNLDLVHVVDPFKSSPATTAKLRYYRLHGVTGTRHRYSNEELRQLKEFCAGRTPTYCMFNNLAMVQDAQRFAKLLSATRIAG
jgi:uncharacterized protein YecE (DUF72 family)